MIYCLFYGMSVLFLLSFLPLLLQEGAWKTPNVLYVLYDGNENLKEALFLPSDEAVETPISYSTTQSDDEMSEEEVIPPSNRIMNETIPTQPVETIVSTNSLSRRSFHPFPWNDGFGSCHFFF